MPGRPISFVVWLVFALFVAVPVVGQDFEPVSIDRFRHRSRSMHLDTYRELIEPRKEVDLYYAQRKSFDSSTPLVISPDLRRRRQNEFIPSENERRSQSLYLRSGGTL